MALVLTPPAVRLPSMKPVRDKVLTALQADFAQALAIVAATFGVDPATLPAPLADGGFSEEVVNEYSLVQQWPFLTVFSGISQPDTAFQQRGGGIWKGQVRVRLFLQNDDGQALTASIDHYAAAVWLVVMNADEQRALGGELDPTSLQVEPDPGGGVQFERAVEVRFDVRVWN